MSNKPFARTPAEKSQLYGSQDLAAAFFLFQRRNCSCHRRKHNNHLIRWKDRHVCGVRASDYQVEQLTWTCFTYLKVTRQYFSCMLCSKLASEPFRGCHLPRLQVGVVIACFLFVSLPPDSQAIHYCNHDSQKPNGAVSLQPDQS